MCFHGKRLVEQRLDHVIYWIKNIKLLDRDLLSGKHYPGFVQPALCLGFEEKVEGVYLYYIVLNDSK